MLSATCEVGGPETGDQGDAVPPERVELGDQRYGRPLAVTARPSDLALIPGFQVGLVLCQDQADPARESAALALDEVTEHFLHAPLAGCRMPAEDVLGQCRKLRADRRRRAFEQPHDLGGRERSRVLRHRPAARTTSRAIPTRWICFVPS